MNLVWFLALLLPALVAWIVIAWLRGSRAAKVLSDVPNERSLHATVTQSGVEVPGSIAVNGTTVTFAPLAFFPGNTAITFTMNGWITRLKKNPASA